MYTCSSRNIGKNALPEMFTHHTMGLCHCWNNCARVFESKHKILYDICSV